MNRSLNPLLLLALGLLPASGAIVFSNSFEDSNLAPEIGTWNINNNPNSSIVATGGDPTLGNGVALIDLEVPTSTNTLSIGIPLSTAADITNGNSITFSFDVAARRTNGFAKTTYITAFDSNNNPVAQFVLGDSNAYGNGGNDRQRPGFGTSTGRTALGNSFYWGSDSNPADGFNTLRDAHFEFTISDAGMDITGARQDNTSPINRTGDPLWDGSAFTDVASFEITSEGAGYGLYWDNITIATTVVPEPSTTLLSSLTILNLLSRRRRK